MKKTFVIVLVLAMVLALAGCKGGKKEDPTTAATTETATKETQTTTEAATEPVTEPSSEEITSGAMTPDDPVVYQLTGIDSNEWYVPTGIDTILLTASGRLTLLTNGELKQSVGPEVTLAKDAVAVDLFNYGNGGYRVVLFIRSDGSLSAVSANDMINNHKITILDNIGGLKYVAEVYETMDLDAFGIIARTQDGTETLIDPFLE